MGSGVSHLICINERFGIIERHLIGFYDRFNCLRWKKSGEQNKIDFISAVWYCSAMGDIIMMIKISVVILTGLETMRSLFLLRP